MAPVSSIANNFFIVLDQDEELLEKAKLMLSEKKNELKRFVLFEESKQQSENFEESLLALARCAEKHDLLVLADEIYTKYLFSGSFIPFSTLPGMKDRTVTLNSFSKNFMMTGWRVGVIIGPEEI